MTELERQPNGSFVAAPQTEASLESTSPRPKRTTKAKAEKADEQPMENTLTQGTLLIRGWTSLNLRGHSITTWTREGG